MDGVSLRTLVAAVVIVIKNISPAEYLTHLLELDKESIRLRFGVALNEHAITSYVMGIPKDDYLIGAIDRDNAGLLGAVHLALDDAHKQAEVGISTALKYRREGVAQTLMEYILAMCRNRNIEQLYMMCLSSNQAMINLCKKAGLAVVSKNGESETILELPKLNVDSLVKEFTMTNMIIADLIMKPFSASWKNWIKGFRLQDSK